MTFELHSKARLFVPPGLPIGSARRMRFAEQSAGFNPAHVAEGFRRLGPVLSFDGAINALFPGATGTSYSAPDGLEGAISFSELGGMPLQSVR